MQRSIQEKVLKLIGRHYPWGEGGYLQPLRGADDQAVLRAISFWLEDKTLQFNSTALTLIAKIQPILDELIERLPANEKPRFLARIDHTALVKSPESILEKIVRQWDPESGSAPSTGFDSFTNDLEDIGRFRIVANFLSDVLLIKETLNDCYRKSPISLLSEAQKSLRNDFYLRKNSLEDLVHVQPEDRKKGERCCKGIFYPREERYTAFKIEVQVQTQLQEAWDKKDHFLIYEPRRRGEPVEPSDAIEIFAISELLYVADLTFDRLKRGVMDRRGAKREEKDAHTK